MTDFLSAEPALNFGTLLAGIWIFSPVWGFTPWRAPRSLTENFPKPVKLTSPPRLRVSSTTSEERVDGLAGVALGEAGLGGHLIDEL